MKKLITFLSLTFWISAISQTISLPEFATGFSGPVDIENAGDSRLFVVQQGGAIRIVNPDGSVNPTSFLTLTNATIASGGERGLLGLAFHPNYASNGYFYVNYTRAGDGATVVARYTVSSDPNVADASTALPLLTVAQPFSNHNGGTIKFGPDGYLYIGMGDGGSGGDPGDRAQDIDENLGKMLRIDVDSGTLYGIPADNPYAGIDGNDEIWALGLRNPWKFSWNGDDIWIADVGQSAFEEINHIVNPAPGLNFGWRCYEGNGVYTTCASPPGAVFTYPVAQYSHSGGNCSITGGYVYTGTTYPNMQNKYFFADYCVNRIGMVDVDTYDVTYTPNFAGDNYFTTFGKDINGELYVAASQTGKIHRLIDTSLGLSGSDKMGFSISPNPASSEVTIRFTNASLPAEIKIFDITGKLLVNENLDSNTSTVSTNSLQSGMYVVKIHDNSGAVSSSKLTIK